jgi:hypothetical protein
MANVNPNNLVLRCYGHKTRKGPYVGVCLEFDLAVEAESPEELKMKMIDVIKSYIQTVLDTEDKASIPHLLSRKAPLKDWVLYYIISLLICIRNNLPGKFVFKGHVPFQVAP